LKKIILKNRAETDSSKRLAGLMHKLLKARYTLRYPLLQIKSKSFISLNPVLWIRIRSCMDPHNFGTLDPDPRPHQKSGSASIKNQDPDPHQNDKLDPDPYQFAHEKPKCMEYEPI
jgi:hypothetical protein